MIASFRPDFKCYFSILCVNIEENNAKKETKFLIMAKLSRKIGRSCRSMVDRKITGLEVAGSSPVTITFYHNLITHIITIHQ